jgi:hypothetical protein
LYFPAHPRRIGSREGRIVKQDRRSAAARITGLAVAWLMVSAPAAQAAGAWSLASPMSTPRLGHTATLMEDGRLLVVGGPGEIFAPVTGAWSPASPTTMRFGRSGHAAAALLPQPAGSGGIALPLGGALVTGGVGGAVSSDVEIYDTAADTWIAAAPMGVARVRHTATLLDDGRVLVAGGRAIDPLTLAEQPSDTAEIYDPRTDAWTPTPPMPVARAFHTATLLDDGRVLLVGGDTRTGIATSAVVFDPGAGVWSSPIAMEARRRHTATLLADGRVLIAGGQGTGGFLATAELFDPAAGGFTPAADLPEPRVDHAAAPLGDGTAGSDPGVLVSGGFVVSSTGAAFSSSALVYQPDAGPGAWSAAPSMAAVHSAHAASLVGQGQVLVTGGRDAAGVPSAVAELFTVSVNQAPVALIAPIPPAAVGETCTAAVALDGRGSTDPESEALTFAWTGPFGSASGPSPTVSLGLGRHTVTLTVTDPPGAQGSASAEADVVDLTPPVLTVPAPIVAREGEPITLPMATATDCSAGVVITSDAPATFPLGTTTVTFTARDAAGNVSTGTTTVTVRAADEDTTSARITGHGWLDAGGARHFFSLAAARPPLGPATGRLSFVVWGYTAGNYRFDVFQATAVTGIGFSDDPALTPGGGVTIDTVAMRGAGTWNGAAGFTFEAIAADGGDPRLARDRVRVVVRGPDGTVVASVDGLVRGGYVQSHRAAQRGSCWLFPRASR